MFIKMIESRPTFRLGSRLQCLFRAPALSIGLQEIEFQETMQRDEADTFAHVA